MADFTYIRNYKRLRQTPGHAGCGIRGAGCVGFAGQDDIFLFYILGTEIPSFRTEFDITQFIVECRVGPIRPGPVRISSCLG